MTTIPLALPHAAPYLIEQDYAAYTEEQHACGELARRRMDQLEEHAAREYLEGFEVLAFHVTAADLTAISRRLEPRTAGRQRPSALHAGPGFFRDAGRAPLSTTTCCAGATRSNTPGTRHLSRCLRTRAHARHPVFADFWRTTANSAPAS